MIISTEGMTCGHCEQTIEEALQDVTVDREDKQASVGGDADSTALVEAVKDDGYTAHI